MEIEPHDGLLHKENAETGELEVYSTYVDEMLFDGVVPDPAIRREIIEAIRRAEAIAVTRTLRSAINQLVAMQDRLPTD